MFHVIDLLIPERARVLMNGTAEAVLKCFELCDLHLQTLAIGASEV